jgi:hypothetical protein
MHTHTVHKLMSVCNFDLRPELRKMISRESLALQIRQVVLHQHEILKSLEVASWIELVIRLAANRLSMNQLL